MVLRIESLYLGGMTAARESKAENGKNTVQLRGNNCLQKRRIAAVVVWWGGYS